MYYVARGSIPRQRHTQHRAADGSLYAEELFGVEGFTGRSSLLYHVTPPTRTHRIEAGPRIRLEAADDGLHRHRLTKTGSIEPKGDIVTGRGGSQILVDDVPAGEQVQLPPDRLPAVGRVRVTVTERV